MSETWWLQKPGIPHLAKVRHQSWMLNFIHNPNIPTLLVLNTQFRDSSVTKKLITQTLNNTYLNLYTQGVPGQINHALGEHFLG